MCPDPGWVFHEPDEDGVGHAGWLYHYADGVMVTEEGEVVELPDPGWVFHEPADGAGYAGWLYHYADGVVVAEDGTEYPATLPEQGPRPEPEEEVEPEPVAEPVLDPEPVQEPEAHADPGPDSGSGPGPLSPALPALQREWWTRVRRLATGAARDRRPSAMVAAAVALLVLVGVAGAVAVLTHRSPGARPPETAGPPSLVAPNAVPRNGEYVQSRVSASGEVQVEHWIRSTHPISTVTLAVPPAVSDRSGVVAREVRVESDRRARPAVDVARKRMRSYSLHGASLVRVTYVLTGVVVKSSTSPRRVLAELTALRLSYAHDRVPRTVVVQGGRVLAAACSGPAAGAELVPCGDPEGSRWRVKLGPGARDDRVMVQLALP